MNEDRLCAIEDISERDHHPFVSIKNNKDPSELVINPNGLPYVDWRAQYMGFSNANERWFRAICAECGLCRPEIKLDTDAHVLIDGQERYGLRIYRHQFLQENLQRPLFEVTKVTFSGSNAKEQEKRTRVCCIEDEKIPWPLVFNGTNTDLRMILIDSHVKPQSEDMETIMRKIVMFQPDWVISDKGLGFLDGIELIRQCKQAGIKTIMFTGEIQTDETRRVADVFLEKPVSTQTLLEVMGIPSISE
jgi:CheY-like chemotaxis protein